MTHLTSIVELQTAKERLDREMEQELRDYDKEQNHKKTRELRIKMANFL